MAEKHVSEAIDALFKGMDQFVSTKTVVGDAVKIGDAIILPLVDVTCGMAAGSFQKQAKESGGGGMNARISPSAVLIIQNGVAKLVNVKNQDAMSKVIDMVPDLVNRFMSGKTFDDEIDPEAVETARKLAKDMEDETAEP